MAAVQISKSSMLERTAFFKDLVPSKQGYVDTRIPEHERDTYNVIGRGVTEDPQLKPAIPFPEGFNITYIGAGPGKGAALHSHDSVEVFVILTGKWVIYWGDEGEEEIEVEPFDVVSVPVGVMRGFRNTGTEHGFLMAIMGEDDAGHVDWSPRVLERARATGLDLDADGNLIEVAPGG